MSRVTIGGIILFCLISLGTGQHRCGRYEATQKRINGINPMTLDINYCLNAKLSLQKENNRLISIGLKDKEDFSLYKVTDIRSGFTYFFDRIIFLDEDSAPKTEYQFIKFTTGSKLLVIHRRIIPPPNGYTRYFIISIDITISKKVNELTNGLFEAFEKHTNETTFKLNLLFPNEMNMTRYHGFLSYEQCDSNNPYVWIEVKDPLKLSQKQYYAWNTYSKKPFVSGDIDASHKQMGYLSETGTIRFDCRLKQFHINNGAHVKIDTGLLLFFLSFLTFSIQQIKIY